MKTGVRVAGVGGEGAGLVVGHKFGVQGIIVGVRAGGQGTVVGARGWDSGYRAGG